MAEQGETGTRVCLVSGEYPPMQGGVGDYTAHLAHHLTGQGCTVAVATRVRAGATDEMGNPEVWRSTRRWDYRAFRQLRLRAADWEADIVHLQYQAAAYAMRPAVNLAPLLLRGRGRKTRVVVTFHDLKVPYLFPKAGPLRRLSVLLLASLADACVVTNAEDARAIRASRIGRRSPSTVIPIGSNIPVTQDSLYDREAWRLRLGAGPGEVVIAYFGFLNQMKGVDLLFSAVATLLKRGRPVRLIMVGGTAGDSDPTNRPHETRFRALADSSPFRGRVSWTGFVDRGSVSAHLLASDLCVLPFREGASFRHGTLIAAIEHALPIISTVPPGAPDHDIGEVDDLHPLTSGENAVLVPAGDESALAEAIDRLCGSPEMRQKLAEGAARLAPQFSWRSIASRTAEVYRRVLGT